MNVLVPLPFVLGLGGAAVALLCHGRRKLQRAIALAVTSATVASSVALLVASDRQGHLVTQVGGWPAPFGITLVVDRFSAIMLVVSTAMILVVLVYAIGQLSVERERLYFHPVYLVLTAGVCLSFLTGDLFNLFVAFEVMLMASYVLLTLGGSSGQVRSGMTYLVINLLASTFFVVAIGLTYAATGTVNMAQLALRLGEVDPALRAALGLMFLVVFGVKAAIFPLFFWLPDAYPTAPAPVTALFAGLLTKVGVYAIIRSQTLLFGDLGRPSVLLLAIAGATMLVGVLGAIAQNDIKRILSFHIVSQIGYMILGLALFSLAGLAGAILYIVHHIVVKTTLFLVAGVVERMAGTASLTRLGGFSRMVPVLGILFLLPAFSLAGIPPFSGFVAKLALVQAGLESGRLLVIGVSLLVSLLTLFSMTKIWGGVFWGAPEPAALSEGPAGGRLRPPSLMTGATGALAALSLVIAVFAEPLYGLSERAAADLLDRDSYTAAVLGEGGGDLLGEGGGEVVEPASPAAAVRGGGS
ncbi:Na+/H+ antiporter subunit D [soil metagenome]